MGAVRHGTAMPPYADGHGEAFVIGPARRSDIAVGSH
jgi:hypothetical protein